MIALGTLQAAIGKRECLPFDADTPVIKGADLAVSLFLRKTFTQFVDCTGLAEHPDAQMIATLRTEYQRALNAIDSTYDGADRVRSLIGEKLVILNDIEGGVPLDEALQSALRRALVQKGSR